MIQRPTSVLRSLVKRGKFLELPAAFDPLTARIVEAAGFKSIYNGGFVTGGMSAISEPLLTMTEQIGVAANIAATVKIPVVMDAGAGWGDDDLDIPVRSAVSVASRSTTRCNAA